MKLGFIGIGNVGGTLAKKMGKKGHSIHLGVRQKSQPEAQKLAQEIGAHATCLEIRECLEKSDVIFLATPWSAVEGIIKDYKTSLAGKILIDCTNPLKADLSGLVFSGDRSGGEYIQEALPQTKVVKAFNTVGYNIMENPVLENRRAVMYFAGQEESSRHLARQLIEDVGFEPVDAGNLSACRLLEPLALLWITSAYKFGLGRDFAFSIIKNK